MDMLRPLKQNHALAYITGVGFVDIVNLENRYKNYLSVNLENICLVFFRSIVLQIHNQFFLEPQCIWREKLEKENFL